MLHDSPGKALRLLTLILLVSAAAFEATAGVRTRTLPPLPERIERSLVERAPPGGRLHAIVEVAPASRWGEVRDGVRLLRPLGGDLWLASFPAAATAALPAHVRRAWDLRPADRIDPRLAAGPDRVAPLDVRVKVFRDGSVDVVRARIRAAGGEVVRGAPRLGVVDARLPAAGVQALAACDDVRWIERAPLPAVDANNNMRWSSNVNPVQNLGIDGAGVLLGMWDGGIADTTHPDLAGRLTAGEPGLSTSIHSTHVAGTAIGDGTNSQSHGGSSLKWRGVATAGEIVAYDRIGVLAEIDTALQVWDIDLTTNSWVMPVTPANCDDFGDYAFDAPEFDDIVTGAYGKRIPIVFAAGNERDDGDCGVPERSGFASLPPPATAKNVIAVAAHQSDGGGMTPFSSWGPTDDGRMKPDLAAPGCQLSDDFGITSPTVGGGYVVQCGTSMAAPVVSGSCAALIQEWRARYPGDPEPATVKALLGGFASDRGNAGPDYKFGLGAVDLLASVVELQTATSVEDGVAHGGADEHLFFVPAGTGTLTVTLAWDDPPGAELADTTLVNDLDVELLSPTLATHLPFVLDPANPGDPAGTGTNRLDNVEQVRVIGPTPGEWKVTVTGTSVPQGPQLYSLVGFDTRPPAGAVAPTATAVSDTSVELTWLRAGDADRAGTLVVRSTATPIAWTPDDGTAYAPGAEPAPGVFVIAADDADHSSVALVDTPLLPGSVHHYALFTYDEVPNYAAAVGDTALTTSLAVDAPAPVVAGAPAVSFRRTGASPFRERTTFRFELPREALVAIDVFDAAGRRVATLLDGPRKVGSHVVEWTGRSSAGRRVGTGIYFVRFRGAGLTAVEKVLVVR